MMRTNSQKRKKEMANLSWQNPKTEALLMKTSLVPLKSSKKKSGNDQNRKKNQNKSRKRWIFGYVTRTDEIEEQKKSIKERFF